MSQVVGHMHALLRPSPVAEANQLPLVLWGEPHQGVWSQGSMDQIASMHELHRLSQLVQDLASVNLLWLAMETGMSREVLLQEQ